MQLFETNLLMATADQIKTLIKSHFENDPDRFMTIALQIAAHEAKHGHGGFADEVRKLIDKSKTSQFKIKPISPELSGLIIEVEPKERLAELIVSDELKNKIQRILKECRQKDKLEKYGLSNRRKLLLTGPPGTGKTMTSSVIAKELHLPLFIILMDKMITKFMGETSAKLRQVFDVIKDRPGVYFFDEFDAIGAERGMDNDVGEMRRVVNSFLQFIEQDKSESMIVAATNNVTLLDKALFRRFDDVLHYNLPTKAEVKELIENRLGPFMDNIKADSISNIAGKLSHAEITQACLDAIKEAVLENKTTVDKTLLERMLKDRKKFYRVQKRTK
ncbi:MAG: ATP-binding protein [Candidatus Brocadiaceae bacterium]|nr:ATP-binding protein [Candidatus Brocadiaceae bacterium]